jgi:serine protease Do
MRPLFALLCLASSSALAQTKGIANLDALFEKVDPSVVTLRVTLKQVQQSEFGFDMRVGVGTGSGVVLHKDGFLATAAHVVENAEGIYVEFKDGSKAEAKIVTLSRTEDIALIKVDKLPKGVVPAVLADSDALKVGQSVFAIGAPMGLNHTLTAGVVSSIRKEPRKGLMPGNVIQTDAALNHGNSGGALFNDKGEVVGIASYIASVSGGSMGLGFAIPSNQVRLRLFERPLPYLGVSLRHLPAQVTELFNWPYDAVMLIEEVRADSPAAKAGLKGGSVAANVGGSEVKLGGDVIVKVGGFGAGETVKIAGYLSDLKVGDPVKYVVLRAGKLLEVEVPIPETIDVPALPPLKAAPKK